MAETRTTLALSNTKLGIVRDLSGVIAADHATLSDANYPPAEALDCRGFETIWVGVEITGGSSPTITLEPLFYDEGAADGARWWRSLIGAPPGVTLIAAPAAQSTPALANGQQVEVRVDGWSRVFLRRSAVTNPGSTTASKILVRPGKPRGRPVR